MLSSLPHLILGIGLILLIIELVMGFTTIILLTLGLAFLITSALMFAGEIEQELLHGIYSITAVTVLLTLFLWRPLKKLQADKAPNDVKSDWIGSTFELEQDVAPGQPGKVRFSGVHWKVNAVTPMTKGETAKIVKVEVGVLHVDKA